MRLQHKRLYHCACFSLAFVWIFTGLTSVFFAPHIGFDILAEAQIYGTLAKLAVYGGGALDIGLGLWLLAQKKVKLCCMVQVLTIVVYSGLLSWIDGSFWLHPFGPVTKNLPIIVLILWVYHTDSHQP
ncbi:MULTISPECIES: DoxX-like family protein [Pseudoalteromonas]|uniref:DoxX-like family protein n=1 Tax=Pseudoalteromonas obscura TaxID=3048491 RepID=A0ABT7EL85_9GAMM|nr:MULTISPECIES: DoxX-like family protein [Pseudoalteromonas]MBQ4837626.1 DoxX-like family protein [Pseudoalteromonas luteoviolacea]MDK2595793.1 DoxX-like family protein [Pseudoalteromonas sp. P94(2023)]